MNEIHKEIGLFLKTKRQKKNLTEEKIAKKTNISMQNILNIESGRFNLLHGEFYQKAFIKLYCSALRIDNKKLLALLNQSNTEIIKDVNLNEKNDEKFIYNKMIPSRSLMLFASFFLIILFVINVFFNSYVKNEKLANINPKPNLNIEPIKEYNSYSNVEELDSKQANYDLENSKDIYGNNELSILKQIVAKDDVWVELIDNDKNTLISTILKKDETFLLPKNGKIIISASNAGAISFKIGNQEPISLGNDGTVLNSEILGTLINKH